MAPVTVQVRLFALLKEKAGRGSLELELPDGATVADALSRLRREPGLEELLESLPVRAAVNREYVSSDAPLAAGDEVAVIPPVSGGAEIHARVVDAPLALDELSRSVVRPGAGAVVTFQGITRTVERLDYEAYSEMAEERIALILADCVE